MTYKENLQANLKLAVPVMASQLGQITVNIVDTLMVGRLGEKALAAVSIGNAVFITLLIISFGFSFAISPLMAEADAKDNYKEGASILKHGFLLNSILIFILLVGVLSSLNTLYFFNQPTDIVDMAIPYLKWMMYSFVPLLLFQTLRQFSEGISQVMIIFYATFLANIVNIVFNYLFIYGKYGFPEMGIEGAAIGSLLSRIFMFIFTLVLLLRNKKAQLYLQNFKWIGLQINIIKKLLKLGVPISLQMLFEVGAFTAAAFIIGYSGKTIDLAAHQIIFSLIAVTFMLCSGLGVAATVRVGNQFGKKNYILLREVGWSVISLSTILMGLFGVIFIIFRYQLPELFAPGQIAVVALCAKLLIVAAILQIPDGLQVVTLGALRGQQDVVVPTLISLFAFWGVAIPLGIYLGIYRNMGAMGVWLSLAIGLYLSAFLLLLRYNSKTNKRIYHETT